VNGLPQMIDAKHLPIVLPEVEKYLPTEDGQPPLGNSSKWAWNTVINEVDFNEKIDNVTIFPLELNTMPGWAGSSWYWMRYMDAHNENEFASADALKYWENVDLYIGGSEHATGHLLYSRFWNKFLKDRGYAPTEEPFKKLINQGMILGLSAFLYRLEVQVSGYHSKSGNTISFDGNIISANKDFFVSSDLLAEFLDKKDLKEFSGEGFSQTLLETPIKCTLTDYIYNSCGFSEDVTNEIKNNKKVLIIYAWPIPIDVNNVDASNSIIDEDNFKKYYGFENLDSVKNNSKLITERVVEKMSKSKLNVVNPDDICNDYGADTLRLYEMFLGPLEQAKPWNTAGITGVSGFLKKLWRLYFDDNSGLNITNDEPTADMYKSLHKTIKKVTEDIENFSFNTSVSQFMICVNELAQMKCHHRAILEPLAIVISPYAPHIAEELWSQLGHEGSISTVDFPICEEKYLVESEKEYPVSFNGKMRFTIKLPLDLTVPQIQEIVMADDRTIKQLDGRTPNKVIIVPGKVINLVG
jgi:leucyl-tRNA synthetase